MGRVVDMLTTPQTARARMRAGSGFEAETSVTVTPVGLLAIGGLVAAILLSASPLVRSRRRGNAEVTLPEREAVPALPAPSRDEE